METAQGIVDRKFTNLPNLARYSYFLSSFTNLQRASNGVSKSQLGLRISNSNQRKNDDVVTAFELSAFILPRKLGDSKNSGDVAKDKVLRCKKRCKRKFKLIHVLEISCNIV